MSEPGEYNSMARQIENYYGSIDSETWILCPACDGSGEDHSGLGLCLRCGGQGEILEKSENFL